MRHRSDDDNATLPFPTAPISNGEWVPLPVTQKQELAAKLIADETAARARRHGMTRGQFLRTAAATTTAFMVLNKIHGLEQSGEAAVLPVTGAHCDDLDAARELLDHRVFVMDVQTHHIDTTQGTASTGCFLRFNGAINRFRDMGYHVSQSDLTCPTVLGQMNFVKEFFIDSETDVAVLSGLPYSGVLIGPKAMADTRDLVNQLAGSQRALSQAMIEPKAPPGLVTSLDSFERQVKEFGAVALKCYTYSGNWRLDDEVVAYPMLAEATRLGLGLVNVHKGLPATFAPGSEEFVRTTDFPKVVRDWPNLKFCAYHSGYFQGDHPEGKDGLTEFLEVIASIPKPLRKNVYAEIGSTFGFLLLQGPDQVAHLLGQLLKALGPRNILWGTDSIWWGSPQFLIDAFKVLQIPPAMQQQFGYPPLTDAVKRRILGGNAARLYKVNKRERRCSVPADRLVAIQTDQGGHRAGRSLRWYGAQTRREFLTMLRAERRAHFRG
jgi:uncharacterized protein